MRQSNGNLARGLFAGSALVLASLALGRCGQDRTTLDDIAWSPDWASVAVSALALIVSLVAVLLVYLTLRHQRESSQRQLRAYVSFRRAQLVVPLGGQPRVVVQLINSGQTPAYDLKVLCGIGYRVPGLQEELSVEGLSIEESVSTLGQMVDTEIAVEVAGQPIVDQALIDELKKNGAYAVRVVGRCTYRDAFGSKRRTNWRLYSSWLHGNLVLHPAPAGNEAT